MLLEVALFLVLLVAVWYVRLRPRSPFNVRPRYTLLHKVPAVPTYSTSPFPSFDYVVIGGGPGGLAAARALLERTSCTGSTVLLIEKGGEPLPDSAWGAYAQVANRDRLLSFAPDNVFLPTGSGLLPGRLGPTLAGPCVDDGAVAHRPFRLPELDSDADSSDNGEGERRWDATSSKTATATACHSAKAASKGVRARIMDVLHAYTPYPQGSGLGGSALLDWGVHLPSIFAAGEEANRSLPTERTTEDATVSFVPRQWWERPLSVPAVRNPLSWAFAEAAAKSLVNERYMPTAQQPCRRNAIYPLLQRVDVDGRRLPLSGALFRETTSAELSRLSVLVGHQVLSLNTDDQSAGDVTAGASAPDAIVESVTCMDVATKAKCTIGVDKGIVVCGGVVRSPRLLRTLHSVTSAAPVRTRVRDVLALPFLFRTQPHVSADAANARDAKGGALWYLAQCGPLLQSMTDTVASLPVPELGAKAEMRFVLLPFGGRDPRRFYQLGWDRTLGAFPEAMTILLVISGVEGLTHPLELGTSHGAASPKHLSSSVAARSLLAQRRLSPLAVVEAVPGSDSEASDQDDSNLREAETHHGGEKPSVDGQMPPGLQGKVIAAFVTGMRQCRELTGTAPLSHLVPARGGSVHGSYGEEAVDFSLLKDDPAKALRLARLFHTPKAKQSGAASRDLVRLLEWAYGCVDTEAYMRLYVAQHTYWLGFGSGSSEPFLDAGTSLKVAGIANATVGDNSAVTDALWRAGGMDSLTAGSVSTAIDAGRRAAAVLVKE